MRHVQVHRNVLTRAISIALLVPLAAASQEKPPAPQKDLTLDEIVVTGSRIRRAENEGPTPVTVITGEQLKAEGFSTVYDALTTLTEATGTVQSDVAWGQHTVNASPINLRNLGPGRSLLLVNGRRVADYPLPYGGKSNFANYSSLPTAMVERVEVLASGASAIYGSDAIAGVVNVILKEDYEGNEFKARGGTSSRDGRDTWDLSWVGGVGGDNWNVTYGVQYFKRDPLIAKDRPFMDSDLDAHPDSWGVQQREFGFLVSTGIRLLDTTTGIRQAPPPGACEQYDGFMFTQRRLVWRGDDPPTADDTGTQCGTHTYQYWTLKTGSEDKSGYVHGKWDLDNGMQLWSSVGLWDSEGTESTFLPAAVFDFNDADIGGPINIAKRITPQEMGGLDEIFTVSEEKSWDLYAGIRGRLSDRFDWNVSLGRTEYEVDETYPTVLEQAAFDFFAGPQVGTNAAGEPVYRLDRNRLWNPLSRDQARSLLTHGHNRSSSWVDQAQFTLAGDLLQGWAGPIGFAAVLEYGSQGYELQPDPLADIGDPVPYFSPFGVRDEGGGKRKRYAAGVEFKVPLLASLTGTAAGRFDQYDDDTATDGALTYNAGLEWRPIRSLLFRGSYATSFRAPDMHFVFAKDSQSISDLTDIPRCVAAGDYNNCSREGGYLIDNATIFRKGAPTLEEEEGKSWTVGVVWDAMENLSLSVDYWEIELENIIDDLGADRILDDDAGCRYGFNRDGTPWQGDRNSSYCGVVHSLITRDASGTVTSVRIGPVNQATLNVGGVDIAARYSLSTASLGNFRFSLGYTNQMKYETQFSVTDRLTDKRDEQIRSKIRSSIGWERNSWNATLYADRVGHVRGVNFGGCARGTTGVGCPRVYDRIGPFTTFNTSVGYAFTDNIRTNLYVRNLLDDVGEKDPWKIDFAFTNMEVADFVGREISLEAVIKFD